VSGLARKFLAEHRILRRDTDRQVLRWQTRIMMAPEATARRWRNQILGAEQRGDCNVAAGLELAVGLDVNASAQTVHHQCLLVSASPKLPRNSRVLVELQAETLPLPPS